jgi:hypothetical protein
MEGENLQVPYIVRKFVDRKDNEARYDEEK